VVKQHCQDIYYLKVNHPHPTPLSHRLQSTVHKLSYFCQLMQTKQKNTQKPYLPPWTWHLLDFQIQTQSAKSP